MDDQSGSVIRWYLLFLLVVRREEGEHEVSYPILTEDDDDMMIWESTYSDKKPLFYTYEQKTKTKEEEEKEEEENISFMSKWREFCEMRI